jgi:hypothetical protein
MKEREMLPFISQSSPKKISRDLYGQKSDAQSVPKVESKQRRAFN